MGLLDRFFNRVRIPPFMVGIYGKLPCYKEYFHAPCHPVFGELKARLDEGFENLIHIGAQRPYVWPDRRFFFRMSDPKTDLAGCIFESDDGLRGFPFIMAAPLPRKLCSRPFLESRQILEPLWQYMEAYFEHLRQQTSSGEVYNRVRDVIHELDPITVESLTAEQHPRVRTLDPLSQTLDFRLDDLKAEGEKQLLDSLDIPETPSMILWPRAGWRNDLTDEVYGRLNAKGLPELAMEWFSPNAYAALNPPPETRDDDDKDMSEQTGKEEDSETPADGLDEDRKTESGEAPETDEDQTRDIMGQSSDVETPEPITEPETASEKPKTTREEPARDDPKPPVEPQEEAEIPSEPEATEDRE